MLHIVDLPLQAFLFKVFRPLAQGDGPSLTRLTQAIADQLRFDSYPSGEYVLQEERMPEGSSSSCRAIYWRPRKLEAPISPSLSTCEATTLESARSSHTP